MCHLHVRLAQQFDEKGEGLPLGTRQETPDGDEDDNDVMMMMMLRKRRVMMKMMLPGSTCTRANRRKLRRWCSPGQNYLNTVFSSFLLTL